MINYFIMQCYVNVFLAVMMGASLMDFLVLDFKVKIWNENLARALDIIFIYMDPRYLSMIMGR